MKLTWLQQFSESWLAQNRLGRVPHAVILQGPVGAGKRGAAAWLARQYLGMDGLNSLPEYPLDIPQHADLHWLTILEDKRTVGIDQIRELVDTIRLTSYEGGGKVAVIDPATAMTMAAANSLLKTLEEPPGASLLILIADRASRLPATVMSRCQRINLPAPAEAVGLRWLEQLKPTGNWPAALRAAGNAPLAAIEIHERLAEIDEMARDFSALGQGQAAPLAVAERWSKREPEFILDWLCRAIQSVIQRVSGCQQQPGGPKLADSVLRRIDRRNLFCYLDIINRLRGQPAGSFNVQLTLDSLLIDWAEGLVNCRGDPNSPLWESR